MYLPYWKGTFLSRLKWCTINQVAIYQTSHYFAIDCSCPKIKASLQIEHSKKYLSYPHNRQQQIPTHIQTWKQQHPNKGSATHQPWWFDLNKAPSTQGKSFVNCCVNAKTARSRKHAKCTHPSNQIDITTFCCIKEDKSGRLHCGH